MTDPMTRQKMYITLLNLTAPVKEGKHIGDITSISMWVNHDHENGTTEFDYHYYQFGLASCKTSVIDDSDKVIFKYFCEDFKDYFTHNTDFSVAVPGNILSLGRLNGMAFDALDATSEYLEKNRILETIKKEKSFTNNIDFSAFTFVRNNNKHLLLFYKQNTVEEFHIDFGYTTRGAKKIECMIKSVLDEISVKGIECLEKDYSEVISMYKALKEVMHYASNVANAFAY